MVTQSSRFGWGSFPLVSCVLRVCTKVNDISSFMAYHAEWFHCTKNPISTIYPFLSLARGSHWPFSCPPTFVFPRMSWSWNHTALAFSAWLLSLSNMHFGILHVSLWPDGSFLSRTIPLLDESWFIYSFTYWKTTASQRWQLWTHTFL
jgi:hypothetical protein